MEELKYTLVKTPEELASAIENLSPQPALGFDAETTSLDPFDQAKGTRLRLVQFAAPNSTYVFDLDRIVPEGTRGTRAEELSGSVALDPLRRLLAARAPVKIAHNAKFDAKWVRAFLGVELCGEFDSRTNSNGAERVERGGLFDTMLASQVVSAGEQEDRHSLEAVVGRYLDRAVDKSQQVSDWGGELSPAQLEYAARDAALLLPLRDKLVEALRSASLGRCAQLEFECVVPVATLELNGIFLDKERWREQLAVVEKRRAVLAEELQVMLAEESPQQSFFGPTRLDINLDSHVQLTRALQRRGIELPDGTRNWKLQPLAEKHAEIKTLLEYRTVQKALTSYGENILEEIKPATGRLHANFHQIGAPTGRMACTQPNIQQVPHAHEYRRC
ncbi:MAG TPA: DNA polymerase, partial [Pyrinomonadaceae bacterium]|nr:DNA polymerase [Pyrinomonadaceae bacterium]